MTGSQGRPVILMGCGRLGSAIVEGWLATGAVAAPDLIILTPSPKPVAEGARSRGARLNPPAAELSAARALVVAVKPAVWRAASVETARCLAPEAVVVSVMAGVRTSDIATAFGRPVARVMPTTAVAQASGVAALWTDHSLACVEAHRLFDPLAEVVDLMSEDQMDAATAVAGSGPAFLYAFVAAMAEAGQAAGLDAAAAGRLARGALRSAAAGAQGSLSIDALIARIASPGGTTQAGLDALKAAGVNADAAIAAAVRRARDLG